STYNSPITIVVTLVILQLITAGGEAQIYSSVAQEIASAFSIGVVLGIIAGVFWLRVLYELRGGSYEDILTLAFALMGFSTVQVLGGNGAIFALIFGLVLGNGNVVARIFRMEKRASAGVLMKRFQAQISFLVRTFFFIYIGVVFLLPSPLILVYSIILAAILVLVRYAATVISLLGDTILLDYRHIVTAIMPRGLSTAVLTPLVIAANVKNADILVQIVITMIILTAIIATAGSYYFHHKEVA
ncbi:TPA: cation:proton antiporter, partial [archaeon]|nr:cation:proton antiporter [Candidatus Naiadarchaeales archaeon SRR2090153.bin1042]